MNLKQKQDPIENQQKEYGYKLITLCFYTNTIVIIFLSIYFLLLPACLMIHYINDTGLKESKMPGFAYQFHRSLSAKYEKWARGRVVSKKAEGLSLNDISGTEWPVFGSVFYLLATESLQQAWEKNKDLSSAAPKIYAAGAIEVAVELVADPGHASWVKQHWGEDYLHRENVFYRMLLINALTSYQKLLGKEKYTSLLRDQVETLSKELDESPHGLLDDYPRQCYPTDIVAAIAAINRADTVLGTDHSDFIKRSVRAFEGRFVDSTGLPPYEADSTTGIIGKARGCSSQWITVWTPDLWPDYSKQLYENFDKHFWQERWTAVGFREFPKDDSGCEWYFDVDSGPVIAGFGAAASAFGIGAARANGRFDHAYPLTTQAIVFSWPLLNGTLAGPRLLSNSTDAPYLGEASILFSLTRMPAEGFDIVTDDYAPKIVYIAISSLFIIFFLIAVSLIISVKKFYKSDSHNLKIKMPKIQFSIWCVLIAAACLLYFKVNILFGILSLLLTQIFPKYKIIKK